MRKPPFGAVFLYKTKVLDYRITGGVNYDRVSNRARR